MRVTYSENDAKARTKRNPPRESMLTNQQRPGGCDA